MGMSMGVVGTFSSCVGFVPGDLRGTEGGLEEGEDVSCVDEDEKDDFVRLVSLDTQLWAVVDGNSRVLSKRYTLERTAITDTTAQEMATRDM